MKRASICCQNGMRLKIKISGVQGAGKGVMSDELTNVLIANGFTVDKSETNDISGSRTLTVSRPKVIPE